VHPAVFDAYLDSTLLQTFADRAERHLRRRLHQLPPDERPLLLLQQRCSVRAISANPGNQVCCCERHRNLGRFGRFLSI
jgi:hypothetical protein